MDIQNADEKELSEMKAWFFKENVRIMQAKQELEEERRAFEREKKESLRELKKQQSVEELAGKRLKKEQELFDKKVAVLQRELRQLAYERQKLEQEKAVLKELKAQQARMQTPPPAAMSARFFFKGVDSELALKKRYRDLTKIFHPDNLNGDTDTLKNINREYDALKKLYCI
ncbi:MAG: hypothetical protein J6B06_01445 [Lachnospiraceae bacterium]|nr:hypothetical protein [Lachnospiraceae bacterium]